MLKNDRLLPGVSQTAVPPSVSMRNLAVTVEQARYDRFVRDAVDVLLLLLVDTLFLAWPTSHIPFLSRELSGAILVAAHVGLIAHFVVTRSLPRYRAQRIAQTWSATEQSKVRIK
jgi:hypothetical protein